MDDLIKYGMYILTGAMGWFIRVLWDAQKEMRDNMKKIELDMVSNYIKKNDFKEVIGELKDDIRELTQPLVNKLDKIETYLLHRYKDETKTQ